jgi:endonuclease/exonuclease/phosphatase family metal-dependent hydrolase
MAKKKTTRKNKIGIFSLIIIILNLIAALCLVLSYLAFHVSPAKNWILPFFGLAYPYLLIINTIFLVIWVAMRRWWFLVISLAAILFGWNHLGRIYRFSGDESFEKDREYFKLTSYNVKNLSNDNVDLFDHGIRNSIINYLDKTGSDVVCLQEMLIIHTDPDHFIDSLSNLLGMQHHSFALYAEGQKRFLDAIFIFSRFPIIRSGQLESDSQHNYAIFSDIVIGEDTFRLYNVHLESIRLKHEDYSFRKLKTAFGKRSDQAGQLASHISQSPYPVVLCGDFNDTPSSYVYQKLSRNMTDAFISSGSGFGNSYIGKLPSFRIDYIFHDEKFISTGFKRDLVRLSDHYPISCYIGLN